jgi:hypothetical protein
MSKIIGEGKYGLRVIFLHPSMKNDKDRDTTFWFHNKQMRDAAYAERKRTLKPVGDFVVITKLKRR